MRARFFLSAAWLLAVLATPSQAATRVDLNGPWQFRIDADGGGEKAGWAKAVPADVETVDVPHTWGIGKHAEHEGLAWYWRTVSVPGALRGRRLELDFGAVFYKARVFLNGALVGEHEGGHTALRVDVTRALGDDDLVAVAGGQPSGGRHDPGLGDEAPATAATSGTTGGTTAGIVRGVVAAPLGRGARAAAGDPHDGRRGRPRRRDRPRVPRAPAARRARRARAGDRLCAGRPWSPRPRSSRCPRRPATSRSRSRPVAPPVALRSHPRCTR